MKIQKGMVMKKSGMLLILLLGAALLLAGCGQEEAPGNSAPAPLKVGLVVDTAGLGDGGFNDAAAAGLNKAGEDFSADIETELIEPKDEEALKNGLRTLGQDKTDLIIAMGYYSAEALAKVAGEYPESRFVLIDHNLPDLQAGSNITCVTFKDNEGSFLAGAAAALKSRTGKIGFIGGVDIPVIHNFETGYIAGARYINRNIEVLSSYIATWNQGFSDPEKGRSLTLDQISGGADVVFHAAGASGLGVFEATASQKKLAIGVDIDQTFVVPEEQRAYILTSILKGVDTAVYDVIKRQMEDELEGGYIQLGIKDGVETYAQNDINKDLLADLKPRLDDIKEQIAGGAIAVPEFAE